MVMNVEIIGDKTRMHVSMYCAKTHINIIAK